MKHLVLVMAAIAALGIRAEESDEERVPLVMLHGWNSDSGIWDQLRILLKKDAGYSNADFLAPNMADDQPIEALARSLAENIERHSFTDRIDIVAHSMGGLVARSMLAQGLIETNRVRRLITLGTPHYGVTLGGSSLSIDEQSAQMVLGSTFLWNLARAWFVDAKRPSAMFCIAGAAYEADDIYTDGLVAAASAALSGEPVFHVNKYHASTFESMGEVIYAMNGGTNDIVYRAVKRFLLTGDAMDDSESDCGRAVLAQLAARGGILCQIVDAKLQPVKYNSFFVSPLVGDHSLLESFGNARFDNFYGSGDFEGLYLGIASTYCGVPAGFCRLGIGVPNGGFKNSDIRYTPVSPAVMIRGGTYTLYQATTDGRTIPLSPEPEPDDYLVEFRKADGSGSMPEAAFAAGQIFNLPECEFLPPEDGVVFAGWLGSDGKRYDDGVLVFDLAEPGGKVTLTAVWE